MALDPLAAITNLTGLFLQRDAGARAADAANINRIQQLATGAQNVAVQNADTNHMLDTNQAILDLLKQAGPEGKQLLDDIIQRETTNVRDSGNKRMRTAQDTAAARTELARMLADRDLSTARRSTGAMSRAATADQTDPFGNRTF
jgi:hypothetical protein